MAPQAAADTEQQQRSGQQKQGRRGESVFDDGSCVPSLSLVRQSGFPVSVDEMLTRRLVGKEMRSDPGADGEILVADHEELRFLAGLIQPSKLGQARRQGSPRSAAIG